MTIAEYQECTYKLYIIQAASTTAEIEPTGLDSTLIRLAVHTPLQGVVEILKRLMKEEILPVDKQGLGDCMYAQAHSIKRSLVDETTCWNSSLLRVSRSLALFKRGSQGL